MRRLIARRCQNRPETIAIKNAPPATAPKLFTEIFLFNKPSFSLMFGISLLEKRKVARPFVDAKVVPWSRETRRARRKIKMRLFAFNGSGSRRSLGIDKAHPRAGFRATGGELYAARPHAFATRPHETRTKPSAIASPASRTTIAFTHLGLCIPLGARSRNASLV